MTKLLITLLLSISAAALAASPDTVYVNGRIYTVDGARPWAEALAIADGKFVAVGTAAEINALVHDSTDVVDLGGHMVMPGIHDAHTHLEWVGLLMHHECTLPQGASPQQIVATLEACDVRRPGGWLTAGIYSPFAFADVRVTNELLTEAFPDTAVYLMDYSVHHGLANAKALALAGIDEGVEDPPGGKFSRHPDTNKLTGELVETANSVLMRVIPAYSEDVYRKSLKWAIAVSNQYGITSVQEASATRRQLKLLNELDNAGELTLRIAAHLIWQYEKFADAPLREIRQLRKDREQYTSAHVDTRFIKFWLDGAPLAPNYTETQLDEEGHVDPTNLLITQEALNKALAELDKAGLTAKMHVAHEGSARTALNALAYTRKTNGDSRILQELSHAGFVHADDIARMPALGAVAEMSPAIWHLTGPGFDELASGFKFKSLQNHAVHTVVGSDWILMPTPNLFPALEGMLDRGAESIDLASALAAMTINGTKVTRQDHVSGSIESGKWANFIVLDRNLFEIPIQQISETVVLRTVFEGDVVYAEDKP